MNRHWTHFVLPHRRVASVAQIPLTWLNGHEVLIVDVDNTLVVPETTTVPEQIRLWIRSVQKTHRVICVSNSPTITQRKQALESFLGCTVYAGGGMKPFLHIWNVLEREYGLIPAQTVVIGDRIFPDVLFGNRVGALTVLVEPFSTEEKRWVQLVRRLERWVLARLSQTQTA